MTLFLHVKSALPCEGLASLETPSIDCSAFNEASTRAADPPLHHLHAVHGSMGAPVPSRRAAVPTLCFARPFLSGHHLVTDGMWVSWAIGALWEGDLAGVRGRGAPLTFFAC